MMKNVLDIETEELEEETNSSTLVKIECKKLGETASGKSWHVMYKGSAGFIPKSVVERLSIIADNMTMVVPDWVLEKNFDE